MIISVRPFVCPLPGLCQSFQVIFIKLCRIMDNCYGNNPFNFGVEPTQSVQMAAILEISVILLHFVTFVIMCYVQYGSDAT